MNHHFASQLIADRNAALAADLEHRALLREIRAARKASIASADQPARARRLFSRRLLSARPAPASA